jgi:nitrate/nitrite transport system substrate-binding protein
MNANDTIRVGFLPLTDCASLVVAAELGFDRKYGIRIELRREASWASVRDKLGSGELDAAHVLYGLVAGVQMGIGCTPVPMAVLMNLSRNGQAITLSQSLAVEGVHDGASLAALVASGRRIVLAHTFPTGNHAMLLHYWLAAHGIDPLREVQLLTLPPPRMIGALRAGQVDGFCVGEPFGRRAVAEGLGFTVAGTHEVWPGHPGKVLGTTALYAEAHSDRAAALVAAVLDAARWIESSPSNREEMVRLMASSAFLNTPVALVRQDWDSPGAVRFFDGGAVNYPYLSDLAWFMAQHRRWGLLRTEDDDMAVARAVNRVDLYAAGAARAGVALPDPVRRSILIDGAAW